MKPSRLEPPRPAGEPSVSSATPYSCQCPLAYFLQPLQGCLFPLGQTLSFCGMVDKSLPFSAGGCFLFYTAQGLASSSRPNSMIVVPALRMGTGRGQSQAVRFCHGFSSSCHRWGCCLLWVPVLQWLCSLSKALPLLPEDVGQDYSISFALVPS